jgi:hypothetical protein
MSGLVFKGLVGFRYSCALNTAKKADVSEIIFLLRTVGEGGISGLVRLRC